MSETLSVPIEVLCPGQPSVRGALPLQLGRMQAGDLLKSCIVERIITLQAARQQSGNEATSSGAATAPGLWNTERQMELALSAIAQQRVLFFVDQTQITDLAQKIEIRADTRVQFLRLLALEGG